MGLIKCPECGSQISDKADSCVNCGCPSSFFRSPPVETSLPITQEVETSPGFLSKLLEPRKITCPRCTGDNIQISLETVGSKNSGRSEVRKKSIITRTGNNIGRATMIGLTGGLWAFTPKKSKYSEIQKGKNKITNKKIAICQNCGHSWHVF